MQLLDGRLIYSATDLNNFLECEHLVELERLVALAERERPAKSAQAELIAGKGIEHEARHLQRLQAQHDVVTIELGENTRESLAAAAAATIASMQAGARIIYQGVFFDGTWLGKSDFLLRVEEPSAKWPWRYEVADTKLALHSKPYFIIQLCFYSEQLAAIQGTAPAYMHVILGDGHQERHRLDHYHAYYRRLKERFEAGIEHDTYPLKVKHCDVCAWDSICTQRREDDNHLSLVARIRRDQIKKLQGMQIASLAALASATAQQRPDGMAESTFLTLHRQARLQQRQREAFSANGGGQKYFYELLDPEDENRGFALLPKPAPGDIFFDMEGDPLYLPGRGLEYLFGVYAPDDPVPFRSFWAHTPLEEKRAFERFVDYLTERRKNFPAMHVYHYAPYEKVALRKLMGLHDTRETEVDDLLRDEVLVDLYVVVRQGIAISQPSYSIKKLEAFYEMKRETETRFGGDSIVMYETWLQNRERQDLLEDIERYNQDDCRSTWMLREWLLKLREESIAAHGALDWYEKQTTPVPCHAEPLEGCKTCAKRLKETRAQSEREKLRDALLRDLQDVDAFTILDRPDEERIRWMLAHLMQYHRREQKPAWWVFYDRCENRDDLIAGDTEALGGLQLCQEIEPFKLKNSEKNFVYTYTFPDQQYKLKPGIVFDPATRKAAGELVAIDLQTNSLQLKRSAIVHAGAPLKALIPGRPIATDAQDASLERVARAPSALVSSFLLRKHPRLHGYKAGASIQPPHVTAGSLTQLVQAMDSTYLFIQGPPGSGKSTKAACVITELLRSGKRIGVISNSHAAIHNLLHKVEETALAHTVRFRGLQKFSDEDSEFSSRLSQAMVESTDDNHAFLTQDWQLAAGTAWLFAREQMAGTLDYLFIDEAGQISLADTIAVSPAAQNIVLLGDPLQLAQVSQGTHPMGIGCSALEHLLGDAATIAPDRGVFLDESYRMHPALCDFISESVYEGRLRSAPQTRQQLVEARGPLSGSGLRFIGIDHTGNTQESSEEALRIADEIETLLLATWTDAKGNIRLLTAEDILVVTPYNAQRRCILREFKKRNIAVRAGTVDKFQGQEAAVVFFSMATSSSDDLPRNIEFLFSRNRFNVAISRARCLAVLVCSPRLLDLRCSTIEQMALANLLCSFVATASQSATPGPQTAQLVLF